MIIHFNGFETTYSRLLLQMERMEMDRTLKN